MTFLVVTLQICKSQGTRPESNMYLFWIQILFCVLLILPGVIEPANMTRRRGLHLESISLVPIHQPRSIKRIQVFESKLNTYLTQLCTLRGSLVLATHQMT
uniref:Uncharacterized protein n=1 Tax=Anguilla anguilla TaxID=7936 RepID=A0A0E9ULV5_ANGAN